MTTIIKLLAATVDTRIAGIALDIAVKVAVVLALAFIATRLLRRSSAALRHSVWTAAIAGALVLPVLAIALPSWHAPLPGAEAMRSLAARAGGALGSTGPSAEPARSDDHVASSVQQAVAQPSAEPSTPTAQRRLAPAAGGGSSAPTTRPVDITRRDAPSSIGWPAIVTLVWLAGATAALVPLLLGLLQLRAIGRRARDVESDALDDFAARLGRSLGIGRVVRVVEGETVATPMTWGIVTPVVLVPAGFGEWPEARQRDVLLHELAHVARYDCLTQYLASIVCALHWYNPLAWVAARSLRIERERACDDRVLLAGARASEYAEHLLTIARTLRTPGVAGTAALAMARPSHLEGRLLAVLDARRERAALTRRRGTVVALGAFTVVAFVAVLAPWSARRAEAVEPDFARFLPAGNYMTPIDTDSVAIRDSSRRDGGIARAHRATTGSGSNESSVSSSSSTSSTSSVTVDTVDGKVVRYGAGSTVIINTGPKSADPSGFSLAGCPVRKPSSSSAEVWSSDNEHLRARVKRGDCQIQLERQGDVGYNSTFTDVTSVAKNGWFEISDTGGSVDHKLRIVADDNGNLSRTWTVDGTNQPYDAAAASWLRNTMLELDRYTDFSNGARMTAIYKEKGVNGVLDEMANTDGDYGKRTQIESLMKMAHLDAAQTARVLGFVTNEMSSDYEKSQMLQALLKQQLVDQSLQSKFIAAASTISGDYERRQVLTALVQKGALSVPSQNAVFTAALHISSDYDMRELLVEVVKKYGLSKETAPAFMLAAARISSDYDMRTLLTTVLDDQPRLDPSIIDSFIDLGAKRISSDYDKAEFFIAVAQKAPNTDAERERIAKAAESISSESDYGRVLAALRRLKNNSGGR